MMLVMVRKRLRGALSEQSINSSGLIGRQQVAGIGRFAGCSAARSCRCRLGLGQNDAAALGDTLSFVQIHQS